MRNKVFIYLIFGFGAILMQSCVSVSGYGTLIHFAPDSLLTRFDCSYKDRLTEENIVVITTTDIKECYLQDTSKMLWIYFVYVDCGRCAIGDKVALYRKYKDKLNLLVISVDYNYEGVKFREQLYKYPIYFIDYKYSLKRVKNYKLFLSDLFGVSCKEVRELASNIILKDGKIIGSFYSGYEGYKLLEKEL